MKQNPDLTFAAEFSLEQLKMADKWMSVENAELLEMPSSHGYKFWIEGKKDKVGFESAISFCMRAEPCEGCAEYSVLVDYKLAVGRLELSSKFFTEIDGILVQYELISGVSHATQTEEHPRWLSVSENRLRCESGEVTQNAECNENNEEERFKKCSKTFSAKLDVKIREVLYGRPENLYEEAPYRDFALLVQDTAFYVNVNYLADLGSPYFESMAECRQKGVRRTVILNRSPEELKIFFDAICTYRKPVISRENFDFVIQFAREFKVTKALRACEQYLIETENLHPIRKLEYAAEFGLGILGDTVIRQLGSGLSALEALHEYCNSNGQRMEEIHPEVLEALDIQEDFVIL